MNYLFQSSVEPDIVDGYYSLSQKLAFSLFCMDQVTRYTTDQVNSMVALHEKVSRGNFLHHCYPMMIDLIQRVIL